MSEKKAFDIYIEYWTPTRAADTFGQVKETFALHQKAFVAIEKYTGGDSVTGDKWQFTGNYEMTGHYVSTIDTTARVKMDGEFYNVVDIEPVGRKRWMKIRIQKTVD